jgi:transcriptional regulator with XRE-family HTH domain
MIDIKTKEEASFVGRRIADTRKQKGLKQTDLAERIGVSVDSVRRWEQGKREPRVNELEKVADVLETSSMFLLGGNTKAYMDDDIPDDPEPSRAKQREVIELKNAWEAEMVKVPVYDIRTCAGYGTLHFLEDAEIIAERLLPAYRVGAISAFNDKKPFITIVEGDSMSAADIRDGDEIVINPAEDVHSGDVALVCYGTNKDTAVQWVYYLPGGGIEIRSATPGFPNIQFTKEQQEFEESPVTIIGRVMAYTGVPKRG